VSDDDSDESSGEHGSNVVVKGAERDSMVLVGDYKIKKRLKGGPSLVEEEKEKMLSELNSQIEGAEEDILDRNSLFRSRQSSLGGTK